MSSSNLPTIPSATSNSSSLTRYGYTGRERDPDTGLMYYRARWYDPQIGRFLSEDPIRFSGRDVNCYAYVKNHPLWFRDPRLSSAATDLDYMIYEVGEILATRELYLIEDDGTRRVILIRLGKPRTFPDSSDYYVPF